MVDVAPTIKAARVRDGIRVHPSKLITIPHPIDPSAVGFLPQEQECTRHAWLFYPLVVRPDAPFTRAELTAFLESKMVEPRPIMAGNIAEQPVMRHVPYRSVGSLPNARLIMRNGLLVGMHQGLAAREREAFVTYLEDFVSSRIVSRR